MINIVIFKNNNNSVTDNNYYSKQYINQSGWLKFDKFSFYNIIVKCNPIIFHMNRRVY